LRAVELGVELMALAGEEMLLSWPVLLRVDMLLGVM
jgi:hypothetical protein